MKLKIKNGLILLFLIVFTVFLAPASKASCIPDPPDKYRIDFESYYSYSKITWKYTDINHTLVENLVNESFCSPELLETEKNVKKLLKNPSRPFFDVFLTPYNII